MKKQDYKEGIVRHEHWLAYGYKHGHFMWMPYYGKKIIVSIWNALSCTLFGHGHTVQEKPDGPTTCTECLRKVPHSSDTIHEHE